MTRMMWVIGAAVAVAAIVYATTTSRKEAPTVAETRGECRVVKDRGLTIWDGSDPACRDQGRR